jgi:hypothetical protein
MLSAEDARVLTREGLRHIAAKEFEEQQRRTAEIAEFDRHVKAVYPMIEEKVIQGIHIAGLGGRSSASFMTSNEVETHAYQMLKQVLVTKGYNVRDRGFDDGYTYEISVDW